VGSPYVTRHHGQAMSKKQAFRFSFSGRQASGLQVNSGRDREEEDCVKQLIICG
jgi:hypothetical protein